MRFTQLGSVLPAALLAVAAATAVAIAQEPASPAPASTAEPTFMDRQYDGRSHFMIAPYIWAPTLKGNFQFSVPGLRKLRGGANPIVSSIQVGPSDYVPKLNTAGMLAFDYRKNEFELFGDAIYLNASTNASIYSVVSGPFGKVRVPLTIESSARLSTAIWEVAAGWAVAHGHNADLTLLAGIRQFPVNLNVDYSATITKKHFALPSGSLTASAYTNDVIWGLKGRAFFGGDHWYIPYYADIGSGNGNTTWQAYGGAGYAFPHGQTIIALWRALNYNDFTPVSTVQKLSLAGPLLGYTFSL
jgi:hypothetical protein